MALGTALSMFLAPLLAAEVGAQYPEVRSLVVPYSVLAVLALLAVEVALVAVWHLLGLAARDEVFDPRALRSVTVVIGCVVTVATLAATVFGHLTFGGRSSAGRSCSSASSARSWAGARWPCSSWCCARCSAPRPPTAASWPR